MSAPLAASEYKRVSVAVRLLAPLPNMSPLRVIALTLWSYALLISFARATVPYSSGDSHGRAPDHVPGLNARATTVRFNLAIS